MNDQGSRDNFHRLSRGRDMARPTDQPVLVRRERYTNARPAPQTARAQNQTSGHGATVIRFNIPSLRLRGLQLWDCSHYSTPLLPGVYHFVDLLWVSHRKWWQLPVVGIQVWF